MREIIGNQKIMCKAESESKSIPFFTFSDELIATNLLKLRKELKLIYPDLSILPFFMKACSIAMKDYPLVNAWVDN